MLRGTHLTPVVERSDPLGRAAADWLGALSERNGEPVPYAFALAVARTEGARPNRATPAAERLASRSG